MDTIPADIFNMKKKHVLGRPRGVQLMSDAPERFDVWDFAERMSGKRHGCGRNNDLSLRKDVTGSPGARSFLWHRSEFLPQVIGGGFEVVERRLNDCASRKNCVCRLLKTLG